jgi:NAD(P)-dependent dehydrogenase (short-subunit alcohol dehydrogenase family)
MNDERGSNEEVEMDILPSEGASRDLAEPPGLAGRVAFVTGGTRGIGAAICEGLAGRGAVVAAGYSRDRERAEGFRDRLVSLGTTASIHQGNVSLAEDCRRAVGEVVEEHGRLDILINNAGITADQTVIKMAADDWHAVLAVNLSGAFFCAQAALETMLERGTGRIINISSLAGQSGNIGQANYAASKSGMFGLTKTMALEAALSLNRAGRLSDGGPSVTVNCIAPGYVATEMVDAIPQKVIDRTIAKIPLGRFGRPSEVARVVAFLCADESSYITGQVWGINGGLEM